MKLTPLDIRHQEFSGAISGYSRKEVREFLEEVSDFLEEVLRQNQGLEERIQDLERRIEEYRQGEEELRRTVISAERISHEIKANAQKEAELIVREAEAAKEKLLREGIQKSREIRMEIEAARNERAQFLAQYRSLLRSFLELSEQYEN
ncbi:cell division initiation protein [Deinobacterium chartae]|uniref:Cell division initiation protein n=1 Tax=Deinobacterium chartae TaxID=521158 RepID=A0A841HWL5_9DEIO|nr:DivIVA domain-containing protein [Deinobacterium chartae]MBB6096639.1 cell division initiation protein [Deinobacterium chartae]